MTDQRVNVDFPDEVLDDIERRYDEHAARVLAGRPHTGELLADIGNDHGLSGVEVHQLVVARKARRLRDRPEPPKPPQRVRQSRGTLSVEQLVTNPANVRDGLGDLVPLTDSIREHGLLQPLTVTEHPGGWYVIIDGHRRFAAGRAAGLTHFSCIIRHGVSRVPDQTVLMLVTNCQRVDLDPFERALAYQSLVDAGLTQADVARQVGATPGMVSETMALLDLDAESIRHIRSGRLTVTDAIAMVRNARRAERARNGQTARGRSKTGGGQRLLISQREAAALARLLDDLRADDPGAGDLENLRKRVRRLRQDHAAYEPRRHHPIGAER